MRYLSFLSTEEALALPSNGDSWREALLIRLAGYEWVTVISGEWDKMHLMRLNWRISLCYVEHVFASGAECTESCYVLSCSH